MSRIGFIGLGNMDGPMASNVARAGHSMVVTDIRREMAKPHLDQGAQWADSPKAVAQASDIVFTSLPGPREVESVDRKSTRLNSSHSQISYAVFCLKKKNNTSTD